MITYKLDFPYRNFKTQKCFFVNLENFSIEPNSAFHLYIYKNFFKQNYIKKHILK